MKIGVISGGFDPIHRGHVDYIKDAKSKCDFLIVGVNSDKWLERKKGKKFMAFEDRIAIVNAMHDVNYATGFNDTDGSAIELIRMAGKMFPQYEIVFMNGGDRTKANIPEMDADFGFKVKFIFGVGGKHKSNSSSWILQEWKAPKTQRPWGYYRVLHEEEFVKVKELVVEPGQTLSRQKHFKRNEYWLVSNGEASVHLDNREYVLNKHMSIDIPIESWHRLYNTSEYPVHIVEIQYGDECIEEDIVRDTTK